jgi:hypothetical protein
MKQETKHIGHPIFSADIFKYWYYFFWFYFFYRTPQYPLKASFVLVYYKRAAYGKFSKEKRQIPMIYSGLTQPMKSYSNNIPLS